MFDVVSDKYLNLFSFEIRQFANGVVGGEWLLGLVDHFEMGVGLGYYWRTVPSVYRDFVDLDGSEIVQEFRLRIMPVTFTLRALPFRNRSRTRPCLGGGLGIFSWQ